MVEDEVKDRDHFPNRKESDDKVSKEKMRKDSEAREGPKKRKPF